VRQAIRGSRARSALDFVLKVWASYNGDDPGKGRLGWYEAYLNRIDPAIAYRRGLAQAAERALSTADTHGLSFEALTTQLEESRGEADDRTNLSIPDYVYSLVHEVGVLIEHPFGRVSFRQPVISGYLAATALRGAPMQEWLVEDRRAGNLVMPFLAQMTDINSYVQYRLESANTVARDETLDIALWVADADRDAPWRSDLFQELTRLMLGLGEFPIMRERAAAALVASRDLNVNFIFRRGLQNPDSHIRALSVLGMGAMGDSEMLITIGETLRDTEPIVQTAAALALGALGTRPALNYMLEVLLSGHEYARRAISETLATNTAGEGHAVLREALQDEDSQTRRAAIYGLQQVGEDWVMDLLQTAETRDDQWLVRTAATNALDMLRTPPPGAGKAVPLPEDTDWLADWLVARDENVESGSLAVSQMIRALQEGDEPIRRAAAEALGALLMVEAITPLYGALRDSNAGIRDVSYRSLGRISQGAGYSLPPVT
jgi:HEAT repeat protein